MTLPSLSTHLLVRKFCSAEDSMAAFFLDIKTAYYSTVREIALGAFESDELVAKVFARFRLEASAASELMDIVRRGGILSDERVGPHMLAVLQDLYRRSWFVTPYSDGAEICRTSVGTRPGSNFADMIFAFVYHRLWQQIRVEAAQQKLTVEVPYTGSPVPWVGADDVIQEHVHCLDATWAEDSVVLTTASEPAQMIPRARQLIRLVLEGCGRFGLTPNLKRGKSALLLALRGPAKELQIPLTGGSTATVCVEGAYLHLGTILDRDGKMLAEARRALARAAGAFNEAREKVLQNEYLALEDRAVVFDGLVRATIFNLELWTDDEPSWAILRDGFHRLQKRLLAKRFHDDDYFALSHSEVLYLTGLQDLESTARRKRIGFLAGLARHGGPAIWAVIQWQGQWSQQLRRDLNWYANWSDDCLPPATAASWPVWWHHLTGNVETLKRRVKRAVKRCRDAQLQHVASMLFLRDAYRLRFGRQKTFEAAGIHVWCCPPCGRSFKTKSGLGAHFKTKHGRAAHYRFYGEGNVCIGCGKAYHSHDRMLMHLKHATACRGKMVAAGLRTESAAAGIKSWQKTRTQDFVLCPPERRDTPLQHEPMDNVLWHEQPLVRDAFQAALDRIVPCESGDADEFFRGVCEQLRSFPLHEHELRAVFAELEKAARHLLRDEGMNLWQNIGPEVLLRLLRDNAQSFSSEVFLPPGFYDERDIQLSDAYLCNPQTWACVARAEQGSCLCIAEQAQVTGDRATTDYVTYQQACTMWSADRWGGLSCVYIRLPHVLEGVEYLRWRARSRTPLSDRRDGNIWDLLKAAICFLGHGGQVHLLSHEDFWSSAIAVPFKSTLVSPCN